MVLENADTQPLGFPPRPLPSLFSVPQAPSASAPQRADLLVFAGPRPHPRHVNDSLNCGASTKETPASPSNMPGKSQGAGASGSAPGTQHPACPHRAGFLFLSPETGFTHPPLPRPYLVLLLKAS